MMSGLKSSINVSNAFVFHFPTAHIRSRIQKSICIRDLFSILVTKPALCILLLPSLFLFSTVPEGIEGFTKFVSNRLSLI